MDDIPSASGRRPRVLAVLDSAAFQRLLASKALSDLGGAMRQAAQAWIVFELTDSQLWVGVVAGVRAVPVLLLGLFGGAVTDHLDRRWIILWSQLALIALAALTGALIAWGDIKPWHLALMSACAGGAIAFRGPAMWALEADLVPRHLLPSANGFMSVVFNVSETAGPAVVGAVLAVSADQNAFWLIAAGHAAAALLILQAPPASTVAAVRSASVVKDIAGGLRYAWNTQPLPWLVGLTAATTLLGVAIFPLIPVYARDVLDSGASGFGMLSGAMGAGFLAGAVALAAFGNSSRRGMVILLAGVAWDACMVAFGFSRLFPLSMALLFVMGVAGAYWENAAITLLQTVTRPEMRGRIMGLWVMTVSMTPLGWLYGGALAQAFGNEAALIVSALGSTPLVAAVYAISRPFREAR